MGFRHNSGPRRAEPHRDTHRAPGKTEAPAGLCRPPETIPVRQCRWGRPGEGPNSELTLLVSLQTSLVTGHVERFPRQGVNTENKYPNDTIYGGKAPPA